MKKERSKNSRRHVYRNARIVNDDLRQRFRLRKGYAQNVGTFRIELRKGSINPVDEGLCEE